MRKRTPAVLLDLDGSAIDGRGAMHYLLSEQRDVDAYHGATRFCPPHDAVMEFVGDARERGYAIAILTARPATYRRETLDWLAKYDVAFASITMRDPGDDRPDRAFKKSAFDALSINYRIDYAVDDNPNVIALWRSLGVATIAVPGYARCASDLAYPFAAVAIRNPWRAPRSIHV